MKKKILLLLILFLGFFLRFYKLGINPPSIYWDETINCYDSFSLSQTGKDHHGISWPLTYLTSYGDFKNPLYTYLGIIPVKLFGLSEFACRFPSAFFGGLTVLVIYLLTRELFLKRKEGDDIALLASFLVAVSPWHLQFSRAGFEANINLFFITLGIYLFIKAVNSRAVFFILSAISFGLTPYAYHSSKLMMPVLLIILITLFFKQISKKIKYLILAGIVGILIISPFLNKESQYAIFYRFTETNIFNEEDVVLKSNQLRAADNWSFLSNIFHNRRIYYTEKFLKHYFDHFQFNYLFLSGDENWRHSTKAVGELYLIELPFLIAGFYFGLRNKEKVLLVPLGWLLLSIVPASITITTPHALRTLSGMGSWQIITAYGIYYLFLNIRNSRLKKSLIGLVIFIFGFSILYYLHNYYSHYPKDSSYYWQYGYKDAVEYIKINYQNYDKVVISDTYGRAYGYLLFYLQYPPEKIQNDFLALSKVGKSSLNDFDKFEISNINYLNRPADSRVLLIGAPSEFPTNIKLLQIINDLSGKGIFKIAVKNK